MKLTNTQIANRKSGVTLLELTVVILVLLTLIGILFVGVSAWRRGSDRTANLLILRSTQQAMRGFQNTTLAKSGDSFPATGTTGLLEYVNAPIAAPTLGGAYAYTGTVTKYTTGPDPVTAPDNLYITGPAAAIPGATPATYTYDTAAAVEGW
jgi:type II secretory pathway pseudopilin PulG